jgi:hypothetical protein
MQDGDKWGQTPLKLIRRMAAAMTQLTSMESDPIYTFAAKKLASTSAISFIR